MGKSHIYVKIKGEIRRKEYSNTTLYYIKIIKLKIRVK